ncbi:MAG TPA: lipid-binding SYLF domain-containing protein [Bryobacteraceae bacterium]|nr:lipid-binding SYLF domain-containing protein [Bryobacteraceae bacterium]HPU72879.1 lipid-binding SYLF domain-containing protein [Bryobacteraceae bacterium]
MKATFALLVACALPAGCGASALRAQQAQQTVPREISERLNESANVLLEMAAGPSDGIPEGDLAKARCIAVIPGLKRGAFIVGAQHGAGFASCRTTAGWSAPAAVKLSGGSIGLQAGGEESDVVMALLNPNAQYQLLQEGLKFGTNATAMAGSVGRVTDNARADALVWSRSGGAFAGVSVNGATLRADDDANRDLYGAGISPELVLSGRVQPPQAADQFMQILSRVAGR